MPLSVLRPAALRARFAGPPPIAVRQGRLRGVVLLDPAVIDPEIGLDVVALGLVYDVSVSAEDHVLVDLTMTTPACPLSEQIIGDAEDAVRVLAGAPSVEVRLVWEPTWTPDRMSDAAREELGWSG